nr:hypothetical protein CFP56_59605 [Quercus suber]
MAMLVTVKAGSRGSINEVEMSPSPSFKVFDREREEDRIGTTLSSKERISSRFAGRAWMALGVGTRGGDLGLDLEIDLFRSLPTRDGVLDITPGPSSTTRPTSSPRFTRRRLQIDVTTYNFADSISQQQRASAMGHANEGYKSGQDGVDVNVAPLMPPSRDPFTTHTVPDRPRVSISGRIQSWTAVALVLSYFVFSIAFYTVLNQEATKVFWFLYLAIATIVAGATALEAYDGLTPLKEALKATAKFEKDDHKFKTSDDALPLVELVFVLEQGNASDLNAMKQIRNALLYPSSLIRINVLCHEHSIAHVLANDYDGTLEMAGVRVYMTPPHAQNSLSARLSHFLQAAGPMAASIMAVFSRDQRPHPHAMRIAVERLMQDAKVDVIQGRTVRVPQGRRSSFFAALANIEHDMVYALLHPGRAITWAFNTALDSNCYWRTEALRAATGATVGRARTGHDIGFTAVAQGAKAANDLRLVCFEPCPATYASYLNTQATEARQWVLAAIRYTSVAFRRNNAKNGSPAAKIGGKSRFAVIYELVILRIASHAILQYLCMAFALLFTEAPSSTLQFAYLIYFPYPVSEWLMVGG